MKIFIGTVFHRKSLILFVISYSMLLDSKNKIHFTFYN